MTRSAICALLTCIAGLAFAGPALANDDFGDASCLFPGKSVVLHGGMHIERAPNGTLAKATFHLAAGANFMVNDVLIAPGTPLGEPVTEKVFDPNLPEQRPFIDVPYTATDAGAITVSGNLLIIIDSAKVYWSDDQVEWMQNGVKTITVSVGCGFSSNTNTNTVTVTNTVTTPGQTVTIPGQTITVTTPGKNRTIIVDHLNRSPQLWGHKSLDNQLVAGKNAKYVVVACNIGNAAAHGVTVTDTLGAGLTFRDKSGGEMIGGKLVWKIGTLGAQKCWTHPVHVKVGLTAGGIRTCNTETVTGDNLKPFPTKRCDHVKKAKPLKPHSGHVTG